MTIELAVFLTAILGPLLTAWFTYKVSRRNRMKLESLQTNDMTHLRSRLDQIEERLGRVETWLFEHERNHAMKGPL